MLDEKVKKIFKKCNYNLYPPIPKNMLIELSNYCNSQCIFCANSKMTRPRGEMNFELLCKLLKDGYELGIREVGFYTTGEPLLYKKLPDAINYAKQIGYEYIYITTNGILADINKLKELIFNGLNSIKFSINAINSEDYKFIHNVDKFDTVMDNLKNIYNYKKKYCNNLKIFVSYIATKYTDYDIKKIKHFFSDYCDEVIIVNVRNQSGMMPIESEFLKCNDENNKIQSSRVIPCHYLFNVLNVSYEGYLTACCTDFQNYLAYADLNKVDIISAWHNSIITKLRKEHLKFKLGNNLCYNCIYGSKKIPKPLDINLATKINENCFISLNKFNKRIKERKSKMELVDLLNNRKELTGETCERNAVPDGKYRLSIHIWIVNDKNEILIQQRSANRKKFPNMWTNTGGACIAGETSIETVFRELKEELDITPSIDNLELIASYKREKDYVDVWVLKQNINITDLKFNDNEVQDAKWVTVEEWKKLLIEEQAVKSSTDYFLKYINNEF